MADGRPSLTERSEVVKSIIDKFYFERMAHAILAITAFLLFVGLSAYHLITGDITFKFFIGLFIPSGFVCGCFGLLMHMFKEALKFIKEVR